MQLFSVVSIRPALTAMAVVLAASATTAQANTDGAADQAPVPAPAAAPSDEDAAGPIIVTGARAAQREAVAEKRNALNTVETLRANDVGKLPDQNVAEAIKRLPGLSVANDQGEGRYVIIRGINPSLINVTLNGQTLPAPEPDGRQVKLTTFPRR